MALDPVLQQIVDQMPGFTGEVHDYPKMRAESVPLATLWHGENGPIEVGQVEDIEIPGEAGDIAVRIIRPSTEPVATLHLLHGGGWAIGGIDFIEPFARRLCRDLSMVIVTSAYRLAPENPFPAAFEDALAAARWTLAHKGELGGAAHPVVIGGESAGGNLAAAVTLGLRDAGATNFDTQLLLFPAVDLRSEAAAYPSRLANADPTLSAESLPVFYRDYCGGHDPADPWISPLASTDLSGLPPAIIVVLSVDPLHDEAVAYADQLREAGVTTDLIEFDNLIHGFTNWSALVPAAADASAVVMDRLRSLMSQSCGLSPQGQTS